MLGIAVDHDGVAMAFRQCLGNRDIGVETVAVLIERRDSERRSEPYRAFVRWQDPGQHVDQRGLAAAVWADDADTVTALDVDREIADDRTAVVALADTGGIDDQRAGRCRRTGGDDGVPGGAAIAAARFPQRL